MGQCPTQTHSAGVPGRDEIVRIAHAVSDPRSPSYGQYLKQAAIDDIVAPRAEDVAIVTDWLEAYAADHGSGRFSYMVAKEVVTLTASALHAGRLLQTTFHTMSNSQTGQQGIRAADVHLPATVADRLQTIYGVHGLPAPPRQTIRRRTAATGGDVEDAPMQAPVTPEVLEKAYSVSGVKASGSLKNRQAVAEFQGQAMNEADLVKFFATFVKGDKVKGDDVVYKFVGDPNSHGTSGEVEASLDIQYIMGIAPHIKTEFWYYQSMDFCGGLKTWTTTILAQDDGPLVHSVSYGYQGNLTTGASMLGCKPGDIDDIDNSFAKIAAKGISISASCHHICQPLQTLVVVEKPPSITRLNATGPCPVCCPFHVTSAMSSFFLCLHCSSNNCNNSYLRADGVPHGLGRIQPARMRTNIAMSSMCLNGVECERTLSFVTRPSTGYDAPTGP